MGPDFLTTAFRAFGALPHDNRVARITRMQDCVGGSTGSKLFLTVEYERPDPGLHTELFVKFSRDFVDPLRDRKAHEMDSEIHFAQLTQEPAFPIEVPRAYFADYHQASHTGMLVTERIAYGTGEIEPQHVKCMDHLLDDPLPYYRANITALARIAAAHKSGLLASQVETLFPFDLAAARAADPIRWTGPELTGHVARFAEFGRQCPALLPDCTHAPGFWDRFEREAQVVREHEMGIKDYLHADPDYIALCHWNANIDNAWYWRDGADVLHCGLIDWGRVRQMNLAYAIWGCLLAAPQWLWDRHLDELLALFVEEFRSAWRPADHGEPVAALFRRLCRRGRACPDDGSPRADPALPARSPVDHRHPRSAPAGLRAGAEPAARRLELPAPVGQP